MRIVSDFRDYYDGVQAEGQDQSMVYVRKDIESWRNRKDFPHMQWPRWQNLRVFWPDARMEIYIIGFCGKIYPLIILQKEYRIASEPYPEHFCFTMEDVDNFVSMYYPNREDAYRTTRRHTKRERGWPEHIMRFKFKEFFDTCEQKQNAYLSLFLENKCPIFVVRQRYYYEDENDCFRANCPLEEYRFYRLFPAYEAFQEISMFLGNLASPNRPIPSVSDKDLVTAKGFDKWSFRKEPTKK